MGRRGGFALLGLLFALGGALFWALRPAAAPSPPPTWTPTMTSVPPTPTRPPTPTATPAPSPTPTCTPGGWAVDRVSVPEMGLDIPLRIHLPPCRESGRRYPTLYLLHGYPYDETHWDQLGVDEALEEGIRGGRWPPFLVVLPGFPDALYVGTSGGPGSVEAVVLERLIPYIEARYPAESARWARAIGGISRGGVWALEIALRHPEAFASVGGHSPALDVNRAPPDYDPFVLARQVDLRGLRVYLDAGDADWARAGAQRLAGILERRGIPVRLEVHPGAHADALWAGAIEAYLDFYAEPWRVTGR